MAKKISFELYDSGGAPLAGQTPTFVKYVTRAGVARTPPSIVDMGGGKYGFVATDADEAVGVAYVVDCGAGAVPSRVYGPVASDGDPFAVYMLVDSVDALWTGSAPTVGRYADFSANVRTSPSVVSAGVAYLYTVTPSTADLAVGVGYRLDAPAGAYPTNLDGEFYFVGASTAAASQPTDWLKLNGIEVSRVAQPSSNPKGDRRDIGEMVQSVDGTYRVTRSARKHDVSFETKPLSGADALIWERFVVGEGEHWSFDSSMYSSKGMGPAAGTGYSVVSGSPKFGAKNMRLAATTGTATFAYPGASFNGSVEAGFTIMIWRYESAAWHHYIVRSDGAKWYDGLRNDSLSTSAWLLVFPTNGAFVLINTSGAAVDYDDLVVLPFLVPESWASVFGTSTVAFSDLPKLNATGKLVREQATRQVLGSAHDAAIMMGSLGDSDGLQNDLRRLSIELKEV